MSDHISHPPTLDQAMSERPTALIVRLPARAVIVKPLGRCSNAQLLLGGYDGDVHSFRIEGEGGRGRPMIERIAAITKHNKKALALLGHLGLVNRSQILEEIDKQNASNKEKSERWLLSHLYDALRRLEMQPTAEQLARFEAVGIAWEGSPS